VAAQAKKSFIGNQKEGLKRPPPFQYSREGVVPPFPTLLSRHCSQMQNKYNFLDILPQLEPGCILNMVNPS